MGGSGQEKVPEDVRPVLGRHDLYTQYSTVRGAHTEDAFNAQL